MAPASADLGREGNVSANACVVGVDYGTLSARAVVVRASDGAELGSAVHEYANGVIDAVLPSTGAKLEESWALQDPGDWLEVLAIAVPAAVQAAGIDPADVVGIATAFTRSACACAAWCFHSFGHACGRSASSGSEHSGVPSLSTGSGVEAVKSVATPTTSLASTPAARTAAGTASRSDSM